MTSSLELPLPHYCFPGFCSLYYHTPFFPSFLILRLQPLSFHLLPLDLSLVMSAIQNIKNFIRHGKQSKPLNAEPTTNVSNVHAQPAMSEPLLDHRAPQAHPIPGEFSAGAVDNRHQAARAAEVVAHTVGQNQKKGASSKKDVDPSILERIIAEERESKGKLPKYPGLERWTLLEKMGDGAFSNVYRAKDNQGQYEQVAIKVVRKFEMNNGQVRTKGFLPFLYTLLSVSCNFCFARTRYPLELF